MTGNAVLALLGGALGLLAAFAAVHWLEDPAVGEAERRWNGNSIGQLSGSP
jgi:hypothetical protein